MSALDRAAEPLEGTAGGDRRAAGALLALVVATGAFAFQQLAVLPALPDIQADLDAGDTYVAWLLSVYLVVASVTAPFLGALADRRGGRPVLLGALLVFLVGSIGAALAPSLAWLIVARALQGVGGVVFPLSFAIARDVLPDRNTAEGLGRLAVAFGVGTALGLAGGGALVALAGWRGVFAGGAVAVALATALCWRLIPASEPQADRGLDLPGALLLAGGLGALLLALTEGPTRGLGPLVVGLVVGGLVLLAAFWVRERRTSDPLLDLSVLRRRDVVLVNLAGLLAGYALFGAVYLAPFAVAEDAGPLLTGLLLTPTAVGQVVAGKVVARLDDRFGGARTFAGGLAACAAGLAVLAVLGPSPLVVAVSLGVVGLGFGVAVVSSNALLTRITPADETGATLSTNSVVRRLGGSAGSQVGAAAVAVLGVSGGVQAATAGGAVVAALGTALALAVRHR